MGELSNQELAQLRAAISTEIGKAYELVILPKLQSVDGKLDAVLKAHDDHKRRLERLEIWRDGFTGMEPARQPKYTIRGVISVLLLLVALLLSIAASLLLVWLTKQV